MGRAWSWRHLTKEPQTPQPQLFQSSHSGVRHVSEPSDNSPPAGSSNVGDLEKELPSGPRSTARSLRDSVVILSQ